MARGFGSAWGTGATDMIATGYTSALPAKFSLACWAYAADAGASSKGRLFSQRNSSTAAETFVGFNASSLQMVCGIIWSTTSPGWTFNWPSFNAWHHFCISYDSTSAGNNPVIYIDGSPVSLTTTSSASGSYTPAATPVDYGNRSTGDRNWDGIVAECGAWSSVLTASQVASLAHGAPPLFMQRASQLYYLPLYGLQSNEPDWGPSRFSQTLTGAKKQNHAPAGFWMPPATMAPASRVTASLALTQGASSTALALKEKFAAATAALQPASSAALSAREKFSGALPLTAPANQALLSGMEGLPATPGRVTVSDAAQGGLLGLADTALYDVQIADSV